MSTYTPHKWRVEQARQFAAKHLKLPHGTYRESAEFVLRVARGLVRLAKAADLLSAIDNGEIPSCWTAEKVNELWQVDHLGVEEKIPAGETDPLLTMQPRKVADVSDGE